MRIKNEFELIYKTDGKLHNIVPLGRGTLKAYELDKGDVTYLHQLIRNFGRIKKQSTSDIIEVQARKCLAVKMDKYPLPGFVTIKGLPVVNLGVLPATYSSDYTSSDVYSLYLYTIALSTFINKSVFSNDLENDVSDFIFSIFMKLFGKRAGLIGAYKNLIPTLKFFIKIYVRAGMFGIKLTPQMIKKTANTLLVNADDLNLDYDFRSTIQFLKAINDNNIIPISENKFSQTIINIGGISSLPIFEDISRFYATMMASEIPGATQFSTFWGKKIKSDLFKKLVFTGVKRLKKYSK